MEVLYWQVAVAGIVAFATWKKNSYGLMAAILFSIWTVTMVYAAPLLAVQLISAWGAWIATCWAKDKIRTLKNKATKANETFSTKNKNAPKYKRYRNIRIVNEQHLAELHKAINTSRQHVYIVSGWVSERIVDDNFYRMLRKALARGVDIYIMYGAIDYDGNHKMSKLGLNALNRLQKLKNTSETFRGQLYLTQAPTHQKILIKDNDYTISGSHNWLSNHHHRNFESSWKMTNPEVIQAEINNFHKTATKQEPIYAQ